MNIRRRWLSGAAVAALLVAGAFAKSFQRGPDAATRVARPASPIYGVTVPERYREWQLVGVSYQTAFDEFRGILGNPIAIKAYRNGALPFPDGAVLVKLAWKRAPLDESPGAFVSGAATTIQIMVKDAARYPDSGGWGFGRFVDGQPVGEGQHQTCFACHQAKVKAHDFVFTRYAQ